jgi:hypothetical protein
MPSSNPTLRVVVTQSEKVLIESLAKQAGKSVSTYLKDLALGSQPNMVSQPSNPCVATDIAEVSQPVCVGTKLPIDWELKQPIVANYAGRQWYIYPVEKVVATRQKSANGAKTWLEVSATFHEDVWAVATKDSQWAQRALALLQQYNAAYCTHRVAFEALPEVTEALAKGWTYDWQNLDGTNTNRIILSDARRYLAALPAEAVEVTEAVEVPMELTRDALVARLAKTPGEAKTMAGTLQNVGKNGGNFKASIVAKWTAGRDTEGISWLPIDPIERAVWRQVAKEVG